MTGRCEPRKWDAVVGIAARTHVPFGKFDLVTRDVELGGCRLELCLELEAARWAAPPTAAANRLE